MCVTNVNVSLIYFDYAYNNLKHKWLYIFIQQNMLPPRTYKGNNLLVI